MAEIDHDIRGEDAEVIIDEDFGTGIYIILSGNGSSIRCYVDDGLLQQLCDRLSDCGYVPAPGEAAAIPCDQELS